MLLSGSVSTASWKRACAAGSLLALALTGCGSTALRGSSAPSNVVGLDNADGGTGTSGGETPGIDATTGGSSPASTTGSATGSGTGGLVSGTGSGTSGTSGTS